LNFEGTNPLKNVSGRLMSFDEIDKFLDENKSRINSVSAYQCKFCGVVTQVINMEVPEDGSCFICITRLN